MKTAGEIEAGASAGVTRFEQEYPGRGPKDVRAHLIGGLLVVRLQGVLTTAEQHLVKSAPSEKGPGPAQAGAGPTHRDGVAVPGGHDRGCHRALVVSLHHDVSTATGEEVTLFTLAGGPEARDARPR